MQALPDVVSPNKPEGFAPTELQVECDPTPKPGTDAFRKFILQNVGGRDVGISRACEIGGKSEHKEGRAWDWGVQASSTSEVALAESVIAWLLATDKDGNEQAVFRRAGLMYMIWNKQIWGTKTRSWKPYTGADPHTSHVHFSFGWPGAMARTSFFAWLGVPPGQEHASIVVPPAEPPTVAKPVPVAASSELSNSTKAVAALSGFAMAYALTELFWRSRHPLE